MSNIAHLDHTTIAILWRLAQAKGVLLGPEISALYYLEEYKSKHLTVPKYKEVIYGKLIAESKMRCELCHGLWHSGAECVYWAKMRKRIAVDPESSSMLAHVRHRITANSTLTYNKR